MSEFKFDPETHRLVATRDFSHGVVSGVKGEDVDTTSLPVSSVEHLVKVAEVAKVVAKDKAGTGGSTVKA